MTGLFVTEKMQRIIRIMTELGAAQAQSSALRSSMKRAAKLLGRHKSLGGVETDADMHSMLVILDVAQQCKAYDEKGKIAYFNANWEKIAPYWHDGFHAQETFARELGLPDWVQMKVYDGTWDPSGASAKVTPMKKEASQPSETLRVIDAKLGLVKRIVGSKIDYLWTAGPGGEQQFDSLTAARQAAEGQLEAA